MTAIGIDMSKNTFHAALDETTVIVFKNSNEGMAIFFSTLRLRDIEKDDATIGVEATGAYHLLLCTHAKRSGWRIVVINPLETYHVIKAQSLRRLKTDRKDALAIRKMVAMGYGYPFADTDETLALKALVVEREGLVAMRREVKTRMEAHGVKQLAVSVPLHDSFSGVLAVLRKEIHGIEKLFAVYEPTTQALLRSIPGVGIFTAAALVAYVGDINRFSSPEKLVAYIGLDCRVHESGTSIKGRGFITKRGNAYLRHVLFNAAFIARQKNPELKNYFLTKTKEGKHYFSALCAVERKLIHLIYAVWKRGTPFEVRISTADA
jgi:transposase